MWTEEEIDPATEREFESTIDQLYKLQPEMDGDRYAPRFLTVDAGARKVWIEFYNEHNQELAEHTGDLAAAYAKLEQYAARFALIIHCVKRVSGEGSIFRSDHVDKSSIEAGIEIVRWFTREAKRIYRMLSETEAEREEREQHDDQYRLKKWIEDRGGEVTPSEVQRGNRRYKNSEVAENVLSQLVQDGQGEFVVEPPSTRGGPPKRVFRLLPTHASTEPLDSAEIRGLGDVDGVEEVA